MRFEKENKIGILQKRSREIEEIRKGGFQGLLNTEIFELGKELAIIGVEIKKLEREPEEENERVLSLGEEGVLPLRDSRSQKFYNSTK